MTYRLRSSVARRNSVTLRREERCCGTRKKLNRSIRELFSLVLWVSFVGVSSGFQNVQFVECRVGGRSVVGSGLAKLVSGCLRGNIHRARQ